MSRLEGLRVEQGLEPVAIDQRGQHADQGGRLFFRRHDAQDLGFEVAVIAAFDPDGVAAERIAQAGIHPEGEPDRELLRGEYLGAEIGIDHRRDSVPGLGAGLGDALLPGLVELVSQMIERGFQQQQRQQAEERYDLRLEWRLDADRRMEQGRPGWQGH